MTGPNGPTASILPRVAPASRKPRKPDPPPAPLCLACPDVRTRSLKICHCPSCHRTFTAITAFDAHRIGPWSDRRCLDPATVTVLRGPRKGDPVFQLEQGHAFECWARVGPGEHPRAADTARRQRPRTPEPIPD